MIALPQAEDRKITLSPGAVIAGTLLSAGLIYGVYYLLRKGISNAAQKKSVEEGNEYDIAKQLRLGFDNDGWWGTDVPRVRRAIQSIPTKKMFDRVQQAYSSLYMGENLMRRMEDELTASEYEEMMAILRSKPQTLTASDIREAQAKQIVYWAKRLNEALNYKVAFIPGRDSDAIAAVLREIPTQSTYKMVEQYYYRAFGKSLADDMRGIRFWKYYDYMKIINAKPL